VLGPVVVLNTEVDVTTPVIMSLVVVTTAFGVVVSPIWTVVDTGSGVVIGAGVVMVMLYGAQKQHDPGTSMNRCPLSSQSSCVIRHNPDSQYSRPSLQSHLMQSPFQNVSPSPYDLPSYEHCLSQPVSSRTHFLVSGSLTHPSSHMHKSHSATSSLPHRDGRCPLLCFWFWQVTKHLQSHEQFFSGAMVVGTTVVVYATVVSSGAAIVVVGTDGADVVVSVDSVVLPTVFDVVVSTASGVVVSPAFGVVVSTVLIVVVSPVGDVVVTTVSVEVSPVGNVEVSTVFVVVSPVIDVVVSMTVVVVSPAFDVVVSMVVVSPVGEVVVSTVLVVVSPSVGVVST